LLDFGLAKAHASDQTTTASSHSVFGYTRRYSPLEQIQDQGTSPQSDIYALGATLYHLLTGVKPPDALERAAALANSKADPLVPAHEVHPILEKELSTVIQKALALSSSDRFQSASEFREKLKAIGRKESTRTSAVRPQIAVPRVGSISDPFHSYSILKPAEIAWSTPRRSWPLAITLVAVAIVVVGVAAALPVWPGDQSIKPISDFARTTTSKSVNSEPVHDGKYDRVRGNSSAAISAAVERDRARPNDKQKRPNRRTPGGPADPPAPSLRNALRVPALLNRVAKQRTTANKY
jgi:serine/threonine protein kinase